MKLDWSKPSAALPQFKVTMMNPGGAQDFKGELNQTCAQSQGAWNFDFRVIKEGPFLDLSKVSAEALQEATEQTWHCQKPRVGLGTSKWIALKSSEKYSPLAMIVMFAHCCEGLSPVSRNLKLLRFTRLASSVDNLKPLSSWIAWKARRFPDQALQRCAMQPCSHAQVRNMQGTFAQMRRVQKNLPQNKLYRRRCKLLSPIFRWKIVSISDLNFHSNKMPLMDR